MKERKHVRDFNSHSCVTMPHHSCSAAVMQLQEKKTKNLQMLIGRNPRPSWRDQALSDGPEKVGRAWSHEHFQMLTDYWSYCSYSRATAVTIQNRTESSEPAPKEDSLAIYFKPVALDRNKPSSAHGPPDPNEVSKLVSQSEASRGFQYTSTPFHYLSLS